MIFTNSAGMYIHIPFCESKCYYCDFYSLPSCEETIKEEYAKALHYHLRESAQYTGKRSGAAAPLVDGIYIGGGTPTSLGVKRLCRLLREIQKHYKVSSNAEITVEANPASLTAAGLKKLRGVGFNRISLGVQAVQETLLQAIGRRHSAEQAADTVHAAKEAGFQNISVDLLYGLPGQSAEMVYASLDTVLTWPVTHISFYGLKLSEESPMGRDKPALPPDDEQADIYLYLCESLAKNGFEQYEISNFARPGYSCRHNMKYWTLQPYLGFGAAAHSDFGGKRYSFVCDVRSYIDGVCNEDSIVDEHELIPMAERAGEYLMLGLRTVRGISPGDYTRLFRASFTGIEKKLEQCAKWGLAENAEGRWRLTPKGFLVSNRIIAELTEP